MATPQVCRYLQGCQQGTCVVWLVWDVGSNNDSRGQHGRCVNTCVGRGRVWLAADQKGEAQVVQAGSSWECGAGLVGCTGLLMNRPEASKQTNKHVVKVDVLWLNSCPHTGPRHLLTAVEDAGFEASLAQQADDRTAAAINSAKVGASQGWTGGTCGCYGLTCGQHERTPSHKKFGCLLHMLQRPASLHSSSSPGITACVLPIAVCFDLQTAGGSLLVGPLFVQPCLHHPGLLCRDDPATHPRCVQTVAAVVSVKEFVSAFVISSV
jgi:hypothetical protein